MIEPYDSLVEDAADYHNDRLLLNQQHFKIGTFERYDVDLTRGRITFSQNGRVHVVADCRPAGSLSHLSGTWLWAWANLQYPPAMRGLSKRARRLGRAQSFVELSEAKWGATEDDAWRATSILEFLAKAEGAYHCPGERVDQFLILRRIQWAG